MKDRTIRIRINYGSYEWKLLIPLDLSAKSVELWDQGLGSQNIDDDEGD